MKARKLLSKDVLTLIWLRYQIGVPIVRLVKDFGIDLSLPSITNLVEYFEESQSKEQSVAITDTITKSLFPKWIIEDCKTIQSQPKNWKYIGRFPLGAWLYEEKINEKIN